MSMCLICRRGKETIPRQRKRISNIFSSPCRTRWQDFYWNERRPSKKGYRYHIQRRLYFIQKYLDALTTTYTRASAPVSVNLRNIRHTYSYVHTYSRDAELDRVSRLNSRLFHSMDAYRS